MDTKDRKRPATTEKRPDDRRRSGTSAPRSGGTKTATRPATAKEQPRQRRQQPAPKTRKPQPSPDVVYTQPGPFNRNRFLLRLITVVAVVLALVFGMSIFFKVDADKITVSGAEKYTAWQVKEASGLNGGENLLGLSDARINSKILDALPYVKRVRVGIKLPDTVNIEIVEMDVVYAVEDTEGGWWLMSSDGVIAEHTNGASAGEHTKILGVKIASAEVGKTAVAADETIYETNAAGETVPQTVLNSERLETAITITQYLESSGIIGQAASVDVTNLKELEVWYGQRFQIKLGDATQLSFKIRSAKSAIDQMGDYQTGVLDASFILRPDQVIHTSFDA